MTFKHKTKNSFLVPHDTFENEAFLKSSPSCKILYITLCKIANRIEFDSPKPTTHWFYHSTKQLAKKSGLSEKSIIFAKKWLNNKHFIDIKRGEFVTGRKNSEDFFRLNGFRIKNGERQKFENHQ